MTEPEALAAALLQLSAHAAKLSAAGPPRGRPRRRDPRPDRGTDHAGQRHEGHPRRPGRDPGRAAGLDERVVALAARLDEIAPGDADGELTVYLPVSVTAVLEARWRGPPGRHRRAPGLGRARLPARLRAPGRRARRLLGAAPALPVRPGLAQRAVVRALPPAPAHHRHARRPGRMADPAADRRRRADGTPRPAGASTPQPATAARPGSGPGHERRLSTAPADSGRPRR